MARDDKANPDEGRKIAEDLVLGKKADFTIGLCNTGVALKSLDVFQNNKHLLMVPMTTGTAVTQKFAPKDSYVFRMVAPDSLQTAFIVSEIVRRGLTRVAIFADSTSYGEGGYRDLETHLAAKQLKPVYVGRFDLGVKSLTPQLLEAKAAGADALIGYTVGPELATLARSRADAKVAAPLFGTCPRPS